ncbi:hypothetical protein B5S30_g2914 [[Candida] boidinii]|nr:hypothetical protein B5S30_g2914 [[Candida] boidinii]
MYFISASFSEQGAYYVSINSTNKIVASAAADGNIVIRSLNKFKNIVANDKTEQKQEDTTAEKNPILEIKNDDKPTTEENIENNDLKDDPKNDAKNDPKDHAKANNETIPVTKKGEENKIQELNKTDENNEDKKEENIPKEINVKAEAKSVVTLPETEISAKDEPINETETSKELSTLSNGITKLTKLNSTPKIDKGKFQEAQKPDNIVGIRSRSRVISLKYANLIENENLLVALYKNGEIYLIEDSNDSKKMKVNKILKISNNTLVDVSWSADDQLLAFSTINNEVIIYDVIYRQVLTTLHIHDDSSSEKSKDSKDNKESKDGKDSKDQKDTLNKDEGNIRAIKGIAFDNSLGKYLLTLGDDRILNILTYTLDDPVELDNSTGKILPSEAVPEKEGEIIARKFNYKIVQSFNNITNSKLNKSSIRKIGWTNDDKLFALPNSSKGKTSLISLLNNTKLSDSASNSNNNGNTNNNTNKWKIWCSLVGHGFKCTQLQFSPIIYKNEKFQDYANNYIKEKPKYEKNYYILATASVDSTVAIWNTSVEAPILVSHEVCVSPIQDICWSKDGRCLFITSSTGELMIGIFEENEFGIPVNEKELELNNPNKEMDIKMPEILKKKDLWLSRQKKYLEITKDESQNAEASNNVKETESKATTGEVSKSTEVSKATLLKSRSNKSDAVTTTTIPQSKDAVKTKNGKKRIQPLLISTSSSSSNTNSVSSLPSTNSDMNILNGRSNQKRAIMELDGPSYSVPKDLQNKVNKMNRALNGDESHDQANGSKRAKRETDTVDFVGSVVLNPSVAFSNVRISIPKIKSNLKFYSPNDEQIYLEVKNGNGHESAPSRIEVLRSNPNSFSSEEVSAKQIFVDFVPNRIHLVTGGEGIFWAIATVTGQIIVYSDSGRRLLPPLILGSPLSFLESKGSYLMAITSIGEVYVWNIEEKKSLFAPTSLYPLLQPIFRNLHHESSLNGGSAGGANGSTNQSSANANSLSGSNDTLSTSGGVVFFNGDLLTRSENLTMCSITANGIPVITLSNGNGYLFNKQMNSWSLISDSWWAFGSQYWDSATTSLTNGDYEQSSSYNDGSDFNSVSVISLLERHTNEEILRRGKGRFFNKISKMMLMKEGYSNLETVISLNHLENKLLISELLKDSKSFKKIFIIYVKRLAEIPLKGRLLEICQDLLGPPQNTSDEDKDDTEKDRSKPSDNDDISFSWSPKICGISKHMLLKDLIFACAKCREVQRILIQYASAINVIDEFQTHK